MPSIFTRIVRGEIPAHKILEDELHLAFLDIRPIKPGHTIVIPKHETDYVFEMDDIALGNLMAFAKRVAAPIKRATNCLKVGIAVIGLEVPHVHIHLVPLNDVADLNFRHARTATGGELADMAALLRKHLAAGG